MQLIILDYFRRWWWVLALFALFNAVTMFAGLTMNLAPLVVITILVLDGPSGVLRVVRVQPLTLRQQGMAWWLLCVVVIPLLWIFPICAGAAVANLTERRHIYELIYHSYNPWFSACLSIWIGVGYSAFNFIIAGLLPARPARSLAGDIAQFLVMVLWSVTFVIPILIGHGFPHKFHDFALWHWLVVAPVPLFVVASAFVAPRFAGRWTMPFASLLRPRGRKPAAAPIGGTTGLPFFLVSIIGRIPLLLGVSGVVGVGLLRQMHGGNEAFPYLYNNIFMFGTLYSAVAGGMIGMRGLRILPISPKLITALLLAGPLSAGLFGTAFILVSESLGFGSLAPLAELAARAFFTAGLAAVGLAIGLRWAKIGWCATVALSLIPMILPKFWDWGNWIAASGLAALVISAAAIHRGVKCSSAIYQSRPLFGYGLGQAGAR
jgi:hypothetical protein